MKVTEQEALTKWCPLARILHDNASYNRRSDIKGPYIPHDSVCIGKECMLFTFSHNTESQSFFTCGLSTH